MIKRYRHNSIPSLSEYKQEFKRAPGLSPITDHAKKYYLPARTDWNHLVSGLTAGQYVYAVNLARTRALEACMDAVGMVYQRMRLIEPEHGYVIWCVSLTPLRGSVDAVMVCEPCLLIHHEHCAGKGCVCRHGMPVVAGDRIEGRTSDKWKAKALELEPGRALVVPSYATAVQLQRAVEIRGHRGVKVKLEDDTYLVWDLGHPPRSVCMGCEAGLCAGHPEYCLRGTVRGKRSPIECCCRHMPIYHAFGRGNAEARDETLEGVSSVT